MRLKSLAEIPVQLAQETSGLLDELQETMFGYQVCLWYKYKDATLTWTADGAAGDHLRFTTQTNSEYFPSHHNKFNNLSTEPRSDHIVCDDAYLKPNPKQPRQPFSTVSVARRVPNFDMGAAEVASEGHV